MTLATTPKIAVLDVMAPQVNDVIRELAGDDFDVRFTTSPDRAELVKLVTECDIILVGPQRIDTEMMSLCGHIRLIQKWGVGVDAIDLDTARAMGIPLAIAAGLNAAPVSEMALALMLAVNRRMMFADHATRQGEWPRPEMRATCMQLDGQTVGLLGFGNIAKQTARRLLGFDTRVLYHSNRRADPATEQALRVQQVPLEQLLAESDVLSLHIPLNDQTRNMINAETIAKMKPGAIIVNTARGGVIDEAALYDALSSGRLRGAGLDVFAAEPPGGANPLWKLDNVVVMPHSGGGVFNNVAKVFGHSLDNMRKVLAGQPISPADVVIPVKAA